MDRSPGSFIFASAAVAVGRVEFLSDDQMGKTKTGSSDEEVNGGKSLFLIGSLKL